MRPIPSDALAVTLARAVTQRHRAPLAGGARVGPRPRAEVNRSRTSPREGRLGVANGGDAAAQAEGLRRMPPVAAPLLQRKCGFELELQVPLLKKTSRGFEDPGLDKQTPAWSRPGCAVKVVQDNASDATMLGWSATSIVELVTEPRDEFGPEDEFLAPLAEARRIAAGIESKTNGLTDVVNLTDVLPEARADLLVGRPTHQTPFGPQPWSDVKSAASVQATYAVQLAGISTWVDAMAAKPRVLRWEPEMLGSARRAATAVAADLGVVDPAFRGLLHVLCLYLVGGSMREARLDKNRVALLVRHSLADLVQRGVLHEETVHALQEAGGAYRGEVIEKLMAAAQRRTGEPLFVQDRDAGAPAVEQWLDGVLRGSEDLQLARWKEMKHIAPEEVGPAGRRLIAPVFEERQVAKEKPPGEWEAMGREYRKLLVAANAAPEATQAPSDATRSVAPPDVSEIVASAAPTGTVSASSSQPTPTTGRDGSGSDARTSAAGFAGANAAAPQRPRPRTGEPVGDSLIATGATTIFFLGNTYRLGGIDAGGRAYSLEWVDGTATRILKLPFATRVAEGKVAILD